MKQGIAYQWEFLGSVLANEDSAEQIKFFKAFLKEMTTWGTTFQQQTQLCWINEKLTDDEKDIIKMLGYKDKIDRKP